jgi:fimbrial chaperone protein
VKTAIMQVPNQRRGSRSLAALLVLLCWSVQAQAGSFRVSPLRVILSAAQPITALTVFNEGDQPAVIQAQAFAWAQDNGQDVYTASKEILLTPPIFTVPARSSQILRLGLRRPADPQRELTYRLYLQEVPPPPAPGFNGLTTALRLGVPIFLMPASGAAPQLQWQATLAPQGTLISLTNTGNAHVKIASFTLSTPDARVSTTQKVSQYVLPGQTQRWRVKLTPSLSLGTHLQLSAKGDMGEEIRVALVVEE